MRWDRLPRDGSEAVQFLGVGPKGSVELYRGEPPGVFRVNVDGTLGLVRSLRAGSSPPGVFQAAFERQGEIWFFLLLPTKELVLLDREGRTKNLPSPEWAVSTIGWMGDAPVVSTLPFPKTDSATRSRIRPKGDPPLVMRYNGDKWEALLNEAFEMPPPPQFDLNEVRFRRELFQAPAYQGRLWLANEYLYRIRLLSPAGRVLLDVDLGPEVLPPRKKPEEVEALRRKVAEQLSQSGLPKGGTWLIPEFAPVLSGIAEGPDGRLYLLTAPGVFGEGMALDRFDPATMELERVSTVGIEPPGRFSMVAAADGLYVGGARESLGRWRLSWEALEAAPWKPVKTWDGSAGPEEPQNSGAPGSTTPQSPLCRPIEEGLLARESRRALSLAPCLAKAPTAAPTRALPFRTAFQLEVLGVPAAEPLGEEPIPLLRKAADLKPCQSPFSLTSTLPNRCASALPSVALLPVAPLFWENALSSGGASFDSLERFGHPLGGWPRWLVHKLASHLDDLPPTAVCRHPPLARLAGDHSPKGREDGSKLRRHFDGSPRDGDRAF